MIDSDGTVGYAVCVLAMPVLWYAITRADNPENHCIDCPAVFAVFSRPNLKTEPYLMPRRTGPNKWIGLGGR